MWHRSEITATFSGKADGQNNTKVLESILNINYLVFSHINGEYAQ
jgi:hypothetical protein